MSPLGEPESRTAELPRPASAKRLRIRRSAAIAVTAFMAWIAAWPLAFALLTAEAPVKAWWSVPLGVLMIAVPMVVSLWSWRSGIDVTVEGITIKGLLNARTIPWNRIDGFATGSDGVSAILDDQSQVRLNPMRAESLPTVLEVGGQDLREAEAARD